MNKTHLKQKFTGQLTCHWFNIHNWYTCQSILSQLVRTSFERLDRSPSSSAFSHWRNVDWSLSILPENEN